jgi:tetratricopeptide (TPR) repeat protein/predicted Ser/Thr protein kinase
MANRTWPMSYDVQLVFREVVDLSPKERERYFAERQIPPDLRAEVESLLRFDTASAEVLTTPISEAARSFLDPDAGPSEVRCGPYQLVRLLGRGGMGSVFLGQRTDGEVEQRVAIKLVGNIVQEPKFRDRFLRERQILASLSHPGIARLLDAGHTATGQPYLVMEYIEGTPLDVYSRDRTVREKLSLFLLVADTVSYAHRNLVIHRDLKPANILVEPSGQPKLLDFGIARIVDESTDRALTKDRLMTPDYASPEQVRGTAQTTATDVYSLGAVLYRLLTGRSPHTPPEGRPESIEVLICTSEAPAPSRLDRSLPRDLDFIVGKALRKQPEERYASVDAFAEDVRALLESRPVRARSGSAWYRTRKFLRRHWVPVSAVAAAIICLAAGLLAANRERTIAQHRFSQLRQLADKMLRFDSELRGLPGSTKARQQIVTLSTEYLEGLGREVHNDRELAMDLANGYLLLGRVQGVPPYPHLGQAAAAEESLRKAGVFVESVLAKSPGRPDALLEAAEIEQDRMILASSDSRDADALTHARQCAGRLDTLIQGGRATPDQAEEAAVLYLNVGLAHMNQHRYEDAIRYAQRSIDRFRSAGSPQQYLANALSLLANALRYSGDLDRALAAITEARRIVDGITFPNETSKGVILYAILFRQGSILGADESIGLDRPADAVEPLQKAFELVEQQAAQDPNDAASRDRVATAGRLLADNLTQQHPERALAVYDLTLRRIREVQENVRARREEALLLAHSSYVLRALHRAREAGERVDAALELLRATRDYPAKQVVLGDTTHFVLCALADQADETGHPERALAVYRDLLDKAMASKPNPESDLRQANDLSQIYLSLAGLYRRTGENGQAESLDARSQELWRAWDRKLPNNAFVLRRLSAVSTKSR